MERSNAFLQSELLPKLWTWWAGITLIRAALSLSWIWRFGEEESFYISLLLVEMLFFGLDIWLAWAAWQIAKGHQQLSATAQAQQIEQLLLAYRFFLIALVASYVGAFFSSQIFSFFLQFSSL